MSGTDEKLFLTGNVFIDCTHRALVDRIAAIREVVQDRSRLIPQLAAFLDDMRCHFNQEVVVIRAAGFPGWREHAEWHDQLHLHMSRLVDYVCEVGSSGAFLEAVPDTIDAMLMRHEIAFDRDYVPYVDAAAERVDGGGIVLPAPALIDEGSCDGDHRRMAEWLKQLDRLAGTDGNALTPQAMALLDSFRCTMNQHLAEERNRLCRSAPRSAVMVQERIGAMQVQFDDVRRRLATGNVDLATVVRGYLVYFYLDHLQADHGYPGLWPLDGGAAGYDTTIAGRFCAA